MSVDRQEMSGLRTLEAMYRGLSADDLLKKIEAYNFNCEGGRLKDCMEWRILRQRFSNTIIKP